MSGDLAPANKPGKKVAGRRKRVAPRGPATGGTGRPDGAARARRPATADKLPTFRAPRGGRRRPEPLRLIPFVHRATHRVGLWLDTHLPAGGTQAECHILAHLAAAGGATVGELHRALEHRRSTLTSVLDRLEARGIVRRTSAPNDRRSFLIELTPAGEAVAARVHAGLAELEGRALQSMPAADLARCIEILERIG